MSRHEFPKAVKVSRLKHATREDNVYCEGCGELLKPGQFDFDHDTPDAMGGKPTFDNCRVLGVACCHSAKSRLDQERISRAKRQEEIALRLKRPKQKIVSAPFPKSGPKRASRPTLPPKQIYVSKDSR